MSVSQLIEVPISGGVAYSLAYRYSFPGREAVYIPGLGSVPSTGSFRYLTYARSLQFLDAAGGGPIFTLPFKDAVRVKGDSDLPNSDDFPAISRSGRWSQKGSFQQRADRLLNDFFPAGYLVFESSGLNTFVTGYRRLPNLSQQLLGEVAIKMTFAGKIPASSYQFRVHMLVRERRSHTGWRSAESQEVLNAAGIFVGDLINHFENKGDSH